LRNRRRQAQLHSVFIGRANYIFGSYDCRERAGRIGGVLKSLFFAFSRLSGIRALVVLAALTVCSCMQATSDVTRADHPNASDAIHSWQTERRRVLRANSRLPFGAFFALAIWSGWFLDTGIANFG
jgi:hypothetical protein